jgi:hypothetical protein
VKFNLISLQNVLKQICSAMIKRNAQEIIATWLLENVNTKKSILLNVLSDIPIFVTMFSIAVLGEFKKNSLIHAWFLFVIKNSVFVLQNTLKAKNVFL